MKRLSGRVRAASLMVVAWASFGSCGDDGTPSASTADTASTVAATSATDASHPDITNLWEESNVDPARLPLGDSSMSTTSPGIGGLYSCAPANPDAPGAAVDGPWIDSTNGTWDSTAKVTVEGEVSWPAAQYSETVEGEVRHLSSNGLPVDVVTGTFPIAASDPAYQYDRNPGSISEHERDYSLPVQPEAAGEPSCLPLEAIGILRNGVVLYNALDARGEDAAAHEALDVCNGHPSQVAYHYHSVPGCIVDTTEGASTIVGWALDGYPIVVERDGDGDLPTNADLDECHGRTSAIDLDGEVITSYHYSATLEFPYTLGCFRGVVTRSE